MGEPEAAGPRTPHPLPRLRDRGLAGTRAGTCRARAVYSTKANSTRAYAMIVTFAMTRAIFLAAVLLTMDTKVAVRARTGKVNAISASRAFAQPIIHRCTRLPTLINSQLSMMRTREVHQAQARLFIAGPVRCQSLFGNLRTACAVRAHLRPVTHTFPQLNLVQGA